MNRAIISTALTLCTLFSVCSCGEKTESSTTETVQSTTSGVLTRTIEFKNISFNISPYWVVTDNNDVLTITTETGDTFRVSYNQMTKVELFEDYYNIGHL